jgi:TatD DNase family protein
LIDFHCHIDLFDDPYRLVTKIAESDVFVLGVTTTPSAWCQSNLLVKGHKRIRTALGLHPQLAYERYNELSLFERLANETKYFGEIGLDGSGDNIDQHKKQEYVFSTILSIAQNAGGKIHSIHSRSAVNRTLDILKKYPHFGIPVLHWFSGSKVELIRAINADCWFSVNWSMVLSKRGRELIKGIPTNRLLTESDGPFVKANGMPASPLNIVSLVGRLAEIKNMETRELAYRIDENFKHLITLLG